MGAAILAPGRRAAGGAAAAAGGGPGPRCPSSRARGAATARAGRSRARGGARAGPVHVDREAVVVESSDAGAAEGAGATIHIGEPWSGYGRLRARDITAQLATAGAATLAVVKLYEATHRKRRTVLEEIDRRPAHGR